jgi:uncharacterized membrane protein YsdA (DUF1294 family)/cold shock CspA family protein
VRYKGRVSEWRDEQGFGFVTPSLGGERVFLHISAFRKRRRRPAANDLVTYELGFDERKRPRAINVLFSLDVVEPPPTKLSLGASIAGVGFFFALVTGVVLAGGLPFSILVLYVGASVIAFIAYSIDKFAALRDGRRTSELTLHLISLVGGWPGALLAQQVLRHKTVKKEFRRGYWFTVAINCAVGIWLITPTGATVLRLLLGTS